jgi:hypothetical protein
LSCFLISLYHRINFALVLFINRHFKHGIIGKYHITLAGTLILELTPSTSSVSSLGILYRTWIQIFILLTMIKDAVTRTCMYLLCFQS